MSTQDKTQDEIQSKNEHLLVLRLRRLGYVTHGEDGVIRPRIRSTIASIVEDLGANWSPMWLERELVLRFEARQGFDDGTEFEPLRCYDVRKFGEANTRDQNVEASDIVNAAERYAVLNPITFAYFAATEESIRIVVDGVVHEFTPPRECCEGYGYGDDDQD